MAGRRQGFEYRKCAGADGKQYFKLRKACSPGVTRVCVLIQRLNCVLWELRSTCGGLKTAPCGMWSWSLRNAGNILQNCTVPQNRDDYENPNRWLLKYGTVFSARWIPIVITQHMGTQCPTCSGSWSRWTVQIQWRGLYQPSRKILVAKGTLRAAAPEGRSRCYMAAEVAIALQLACSDIPPLRGRGLTRARWNLLALNP
jgi:hypothetical protein